METPCDWITRIEGHRKSLSAVPAPLAVIRPRPGSWSCSEILGHLVDSAVNNLTRFVLARNQESLVFPGYDQDAWVRTQDWNGVEWTHLVDLWYLLNRQVGRVVDGTPRADLDRPRFPHTLHRIAWRTWPEDQPVSLAYLIEDYRGHLEHHLECLYRVVEGVGGVGGVR